MEDYLQLHFRAKSVTANLDCQHGDDCASYDIDGDKVFIKQAKIPQAREMFQSEAMGLDLIRQTGVIRVPKVYKLMDHYEGDGAILAIEHISDLRPMNKMWEDYGAKMARLHLYNINLIKTAASNTTSIHKIEEGPEIQTQFGFPSPVFFGPDFHIKEGIWYPTWQDYFVKAILEPQFYKANDKVLNEKWSQLQLGIGKFFNGTEFLPSLCAIDLSRENCAETPTEAVILDPYPCFAHHEFDLIQPLLLKDFPREFYDAYHEVFPKQPGMEKRLHLYEVFGSVIRYNYGMKQYYMKAVNALDKCLEILDQSKS